MTKEFDSIKVIDLFAGVGGFRIALNQVNNSIKKDFYRVVWSNQWEPSRKVQYAADIYTREFGEEDFVNEDIACIKTQDIPRHDLMVGGFPCQDYSVATTKKLSNGLQGKKGVLWWQIYRILKEKGRYKPSFLLLENVDRLLSSPSTQRGRDFAVMLACLDSLGYMVEWRIINAAEYGFPQRRRRVFLVGYKKGTFMYESFKDNYEHRMLDDGILAKAFKCKIKERNKVELFKLYGNKEGIDARLQIKHISDNFNKGGNKTPFCNAGIMYKGNIYTTAVVSTYRGQLKRLGDILLDEKSVPKEFFISREDEKKWKWLKGAKKEERIQKNTGFKYNYSEGAIAYPDDLTKPSRTIITGEGGRSPSRFKHIVRTPSGRLRRLTPLELERLNMFPDNHTEGVPDSARAFLMGNALVIGVIKKILLKLYEANKTREV